MKQIDGLLAMSLARFRRQLTGLSAEELSTLEQRIAVQMMRHRLAKGGHGMERHWAHGKLGLLERRRSATRLERQTRNANAVASLHVVQHESNLVTLPTSGPEERAA
jgi:hypothetical protein